MNDFYVGTRPAPLDQADGLRRLFAGSAKKFLPLAANPHVAFGGVAIERLTAALALLGHHTLIVDAADTSPPAPEAAALEIGPCIESLAPQVSYLPARGLPMRYVNTRGSSARLLDELATVVPQADVVIVHATAPDLARLFTRRAARPLLLAADHPESVKHAYASLKLLAQRCGWMACDLMLVAPPLAPRVPHIASSLARCADNFLGAAIAGWAAVDPASQASDVPGADLCRIVAAQLHLDDDPLWADFPAGLPVAARAARDAAAAAACH
jgi:flagellar biosynthesis protein FlhG